MENRYKTYVSKNRYKTYVSKICCPHCRKWFIQKLHVVEGIQDFIVSFDDIKEEDGENN